MDPALHGIGSSFMGRGEDDSSYTLFRERLETVGIHIAFWRLKRMSLFIHSKQVGQDVRVSRIH